MSGRDIRRLRLVVRRHALPEVRVVFPVQLDTDPTIANLLEQVNEVIPLESNDWGLEDYAVELRDFNGHGFECLHFQQVSLLFANDDEVLIRPLDTDDRRKRRLSGRSQISRDGKRLIDGVAFGRPRLKAPRDRPAVGIPPLKRPRVTFDSDEEDEDEEPRLLLTEHGDGDRTDWRVRKRARFGERGGIALGSFDQDDEEDGDFDESGDDETDDSERDSDFAEDLDDAELANELRDLEADSGPLPDEPETGEERAQSASSDGATGLDLQTLDKISALRMAFPTAGFDACEKSLALHRGDTKSAYFSLQAKHQSRMSLDAVLAYIAPLPTDVSQTGGDAADDEGSDAESVASVVKHYDQHGFPSGSIHDGTASAQVVEAMRKSGLSVKPPVHTKFDDGATAEAGEASPKSLAEESESASDSFSDNDDDSDDDSDEDGDEDGDEDSDEDGDSGPEVVSSKLTQASKVTKLPTVKPPELSEDDESERGSEGGSESDSGSDSDSSGAAGSSDSNDDSDSDDGSDSDSSHSVSDSGDSENGAGANANISDDTDDDNRADRFSSNAVSDDDSLMGNANVDARTTPDQARSTVHPQTSLGIKTDIETPKPIAPGQGKTATQKRNARRRAARIAKQAAAAGEPQQLGQQEPRAQAHEPLNAIANKKAALLQRLGFVQDPPSQVAANVGEGPSTLESASTQSQQSGDRQHAEEDSEAWQDKIAYRAVECVQDGVKLSEPPFPFVQRWDPQQQYHPKDNKKRSGRSKRKQRDQEQSADISGWSSAKRQRHDGYDESYTHPDTADFEETILDYDGDVLEPQADLEQSQNEKVDEESDMPTLPADLSTLPPLDPRKATAGTILTWKQWLLSKSTNWQPQVSSITGMVVGMLGDNTLKVRLAKRDWNRDRNEKVYDDDGNRVYDKFELPALEDEAEEDVEDGYRILDVADMIEPRILQPNTDGGSPAHPPSGPEAADAVRSETQQNVLSRGSAMAEEVPADAERPTVDVQDTDKSQRSGDQNSTSGTLAAAEVIDTSISEDRRHEISLLINDAGFRKDVDPSVTESVRLDLSSPSRQLEEMANDATFASEPLETQRDSNPRLPSEMTSNNIDSQPIILEPFHGFSDPISEPRGGRVAYPQLTLPPSDTPSCRSGRQVDPDYSIDLGEDPSFNFDDPVNVSRSTLGRRSGDERGAPGEKLAEEPGSESEGSASDSSLPSLSELWRSTSSSSSKSPSKQAVLSAVKARKPDVSRDLEYEATMRRIDEAGDISEDDTKENVSMLPKKLVDEPIEKPTPQKLAQKKKAVRPSNPHIKSERDTLTPQRSKPAQTTRSKGSPFVIPEGSQVVSLVTSSPEPELEEHYADDSIDETYNEPSIPAGSGWVKKTRPRRGLSVPAPSINQDTVPKRYGSSQPRQSADKRSNSALGSLLRAKKRVLMS